MPFYTGKTRDGSDMKQVSGMYISEDGTQWSNEPYPIVIDMYIHLNKYDNTITEEYNLILSKKSKASARVRKYILDNYKAFTANSI